MSTSGEESSSEPDTPRGTASTQTGREALSLTPALVYGAWGAAGAYVVVVVFLGIELLVMAGGSLPAIDGRAFLFGTLGDFYGSHVGSVDGFAFGVRGVDALPMSLYYLVPPALLLFCGRQCANTSPAVASDRDSVLQGASIALGYGSIVVVSLGAFAGVTELWAVGINPVRVALVAGVVYPLVFGGLGGYTTRSTARSVLRRQ